jgi:cell division protein FtsZ
MIQFELPKNENSNIIKVIGVGGGGGNAVNYMCNLGIDGVDFIVCNTDQKALNNSSVPTKIQLGPSLTQGLGAGANPEIGQKAGVESIDEIENLLANNTKMVFVTAGMGGGTGTGAAPIVAKAAKDLGILTVGIVTTPFTYEGKRRQRQAEEGINQLRSQVDTILVISNDKLRQNFGNIPASQAFVKADDILATATKCITDVINSQGHIVVDFADVSTVMRNGGSAILGSAVAAGENRAYEAVENAINSPLLNDYNIAGAKWVLLNINSAHGIHEHTLDEVEMIQAYVQDQAGEECDVIFGTGFDDNLGENISVTIIATGFQHNNTEKAYSAEVKKPFSERNKEIYVLGEVTEGPLSEMPNNEEPTAGIEETPTAIVDAMAPTMHIIEEPAIPNVLSIGMGFAKTMMRPTSHTTTQFDVVEEPKVVFELTPSVEEALSIVEEPMVEFSAPSIQEEIIEEPILRYEEITTSPIQMDVHNELEKMFSTTLPEMSFEEKIENPVQDEYVTVKGITLNRRKGSRLLSDSELEAEANFELQKRAFDDRASKLRSMSFNVNKADIDNDENNIPAYMRSGLQLENHPASNEEVYSNINILDANQNNSPISNRNSFLNGKLPD